MKNGLAAPCGDVDVGCVVVPAALAQQPCVTQNLGVPPNANTTDKAAPFFIDTTGLDFKTQPPTRDPANPNYPRATELADGTLPPAGAEGNFIIGPTHAPAPDTIAKDGVPKGTVTSFTISSKDSTIYNPGLIRDDVAGCGNSSIMNTTTVPGNKSSMIVTTSHPGTWTRTIDVYVPAQYKPRHRSAVHRDRRRRLDGVEGREHDARQSDPAAPRAADDRHPDRQRRAGRAGRAARQGIRHRVGRLHAVRRARGAAAGRAARQREADEKSRRPRDHGPELERCCGLHHGVVPSRALSAGAGLFADDGEPAVAVRSVAARRRVGISQRVDGHADAQPHRQGRRARAVRSARRAADPERGAEADPLLVRDGRPGSLLSEPGDPRRHARLDPVGRADGQGAGRQGLSLPVPVCEECQARRPADRRPDAAGRARMAVEGFSIQALPSPAARQAEVPLARPGRVQNSQMVARPLRPFGHLPR